MVLLNEESFSDSALDIELPQLRNHQNNTIPQTHHNTQDNLSIHGEIPQCIPFLGIPSKGRTVSVALPCSILDNVQTFELKGYLIGQIARALTIFGVDEVIVYEDSSKAVNMGAPYNLELFTNMYLGVEQYEECPQPLSDPSDTIGALENQTTEAFDLKSSLNSRASSDSDTGPNDYSSQDLPEAIEHFDDRKWSRSMYMFISNLAYLETPQYIRRTIFKINPILRMAGLQNPLDAPHHPRSHDWIPYREGIVIAPPTLRCTISDVSWIDCGLSIPCRVSGSFPLGARVTIRFHPSSHSRFEQMKNRKQHNYHLIRRKRYRETSFIEGTVVDRREPTDHYGLYFGYRVRAARNLREAIYECSFNKGRYDLVIGTSERGTVLDPCTFKIPEIKKHILIVFGPPFGLEECVEDELSEIPLTSFGSLFDYYLNICHYQKSRTIRTEEALLIALTLLKPYLVGP